MKDVMKNQSGSIVVIVIVIILLFVVFRGCKQVNIKQKGNDTKTEFSVEVKKEREQR